MLSTRLQKYFKDYSAYHKTLGNQVTHILGIPCILFSLLGLLSRISLDLPDTIEPPYVRFDGGTLLLAFGICWYVGSLRKNWKLTAPFSLVLIGFYFLGRAIPPYWNGLFFVGGWILQGLGHIVFERKSPAFLKNLTHVLVGPLWLFAKLLGYTEYKR